MFPSAPPPSVVPSGAPPSNAAPSRIEPLVRRRARVFVGWAAFAAMAEGCVVTPQPEPPTHAPIDVTKLRREETTPAGAGDLVPLVGDRGAAMPNAVLTVVNLDTTDPASTTTVDRDGSFDLTVVMRGVQELRLQTWLDGTRSVPVDVSYDPVAGVATPVVRPSCLTVDPSTWTLDFRSDGAPTPRRVTLANGCPDDVRLTVRTRLPSSAFVAEAGSPTTVPAGGKADVSVTYAPAESGTHADVLFLLVEQADGTTVRYPVSLHGLR